MANYNLTGQKIKDTYPQLAQVNDSNVLVDGLGVASPIVTSSIINFPTEVSRSAAAAGFGAGGLVVDTGSLLTNASFSNPNLTFTRGNGTTFQQSLVTLVPTNATSASRAVSAASATTAGSATTATSASHALYANQAGTATSAGTATTATSASHALYANQAGTATSAGTATTATSASHALYANQAGTATTATTATSASHALYANQAGSATTATTATSASHALYANQAGTATSAGTATTATTASYALTASFLEGGIPQAGLVAGTGTNSIRSTIGATPATADGDSSIAIGNNAQVFSGGTGTIVIGNNASSIDNNRNNSVIIGNGASSYQNGVAIGSNAFSIESAVAIGLNAQNGNNYGVAVGASANSGDEYGIAIGYQSTAGNDSIAIGYGVSATTANEINIGDIFRYNNTSSGSIQLMSSVSTPTRALSAVSSNVAVDGSLSNFFTLAAGGNAWTISNPTNLMNGITYTIKITNGANLLWGSNYNFEGGVAPSLSSGTDLVSFASFGDGQLYCSYLLNLS
jgi:hypothetical protein